MPRNDFISDNLVHMRDRLKQNYAEQHAGEKTQTPSVAPVPAPPPAAAVSRPSGGNGEFERMRRDLAGRLSRDSAAVAAELEYEAVRRGELEKFQQKLADFSRRFEELGASQEADAARRLEHLRIEYFQASGRVSAFESGRIPAAGSSGDGETIRHRDWLAPVVSLIAALLVCVTLLVLFW